MFSYTTNNIHSDAELWRGERLKNVAQLWSWRSGMDQETYRSVSVSSMDSSVEEILKESVAVSPESAHWFLLTPRTQLPTSTSRETNILTLTNSPQNTVFYNSGLWSVPLWPLCNRGVSGAGSGPVPTFEPVLCMSTAMLKIMLLQTSI